ncbi:MAG: hypothetical protein WEC15_04600 [Flavobacteriales bacterium]
MNRSFLHITLLILGLFSVDRMLGQSVCADYQKFNCQPAGDKSWSLNGQSKSAAVQVGRETELNIIIYRGQDYRISICQDAKILGEDIAFRLVEKVRVLREGAKAPQPITDAEGQQTGTTQLVQEDDRMFEEVEKVLWDNTEHDMAKEVEFSCASTKRIAVRVMAPGATGKTRRGGALDIGCLGVLIEHMMTPELGF